MKSFILTLVFGVVLGAAGMWFWQQPRGMSALTPKLEALELTARDLQDDLARGTAIVRRRAKAIGDSALATAADASTTVSIKSKLAADPELSALGIAVDTTNGRVTLAGEVSSPELVGKAMLLALETDGVTEVTSTLQVD